MKRIVIVFCCLTVFLFGSNSFSGDTVLTLQELTRKSSDIIIGKVQSINCFYYNNDTTRIYTSVKVQADVTIKGNVDENEIVEIIFYGGTLNGVSTKVLGSSNYELGEETLLFLNERVSKKFGRRFVVKGRSQGKFTIVNDEITRDSMYPLPETKNGLILPVSQTTSISKNTLLNKINSFSN